MPKLKPLRPENRKVQEKAHKSNLKKQKGSKRKFGIGKKLPDSKYKSFYWIPLLVAVFIFAFYSLKDKKDHSFVDYKLSDTVSISGDVSYKNKSGKVKISYDDGSTYSGKLLKGKFQGQGSLEFPEGDKIEGSFEEGGLEEGLMTLKSGSVWSLNGKDGWQEKSKEPAN